MDIKEIEKAAKKEALGWVELSEDPVPITIAGCKRTLKRAALASIPVVSFLAVMGVLKWLGLLPVLGG
jgi:archaellum component FlaD/FlaE